MSPRTISRRCMVRGALVATGLTGLMSLRAGVASSNSSVYRWRGSVLRVPATILIQGADVARGERLAPLWEAELRRLERIFSLYRPELTLRTLNREGGLHAPPPELVELLSECRTVYRTTGGVFDPTVQPVWDLYLEHFRLNPDDSIGPDTEARARNRERVGFSRVKVETDRIEFLGVGMALTLNGIAQGDVTDRIASLLARANVRNALVDIGEVRALAPRSDGSPWQVGVREDGHEPAGSADPLTTISLSSGAVATSSPAGFEFARQPRHHHLFDAASCVSASTAHGVSVEAPNASLADGLSTAISMMPETAGAAVSLSLSGVRIHRHPKPHTA